MVEAIEDVLLSKLKEEMLSALTESFTNSKLFVKTQRETIESLQLKLKQSEEKFSNFAKVKMCSTCLNYLLLQIQ
jgi:hypothetical protein